VEDLFDLRISSRWHTSASSLLLLLSSERRVSSTLRRFFSGERESKKHVEESVSKKFRVQDKGGASEGEGGRARFDK